VKQYQVVIEPEAVDDIAQIKSMIASGASAVTANRFEDRLMKHLAGFSTAPMRGTRRTSTRPGLRTIGWKRMLTIVFRVDVTASKVFVLAIYYRGRDVAAALQDLDR
jgi:toxin ParE1/3/4